MLHVRNRKRVLLLLLVTAAGIGFLLAMGCALAPEEENGNGNENTNGNGTDPLDARKTSTKLVETWIPDAYSRMDSIMFEAALDEAYQFQLLPADAEELDQDWWDKEVELTTAGNMFNARYNTRGETVQLIRLTIDERLNVADSDIWPDKPPGEVWRRVTTAVDLSVVVDDPDAPDGGGITNYVVLSEQIFVCRPDPDADSLWVVYRQQDQPWIN